MLRLKCKSKLVHKIRDYYKSTFDLKTLQIENQEFRDGLSISLRESIRTELFDATWRKSYLIMYVYIQQLKL